MTTELPAETRLGATRLRVGDLERVRTFYEDAIGLRPLGDANGVTALGIDESPLVELVEDRAAPPRPRGSTGLFHLALLVPSRADLAQALRRFVSAGGRLDGASDHLVSEALYLSDPEGNGIELYRDRPRGDWPRDGDGLQMATLPLDLQDLLSEPEPAATDGMPAGTTLGHVHLQVSDLDPARAFWVEALGFDLMAAMPPHALFVSAGGYHHHVGLNTWAGIGAPRPPEGARGLVRFDVVLPSEADVAAAASRAAEAGETSTIDEGVLVVDPSGNAALLRA